MLLGVTGGIATGKTTVVRMLEELGAPVIDFDLLAREVVEPRKPAWKDIVGYFGEDILLEDGSLDREKLSGIVFQEVEKRKILERFTHPRIYEASDRKVKKICEKDPNAIIQLDIPLLIEQNLQHMVDKILVVYIPREKQIERLMERDRMSREAAVDRLGAQLSIDEKLGWADFVINNEKSLEETKKQVEDLWKTLKEIQRQNQGKRNGL
ncbi:MAG: dephospho-CoA kinase [Deltaproteobacteria bacterium]|nr:dephospho-CoA kinase [Deltaproteobacteria bacterium]